MAREGLTGQALNEALQDASEEAPDENSDPEGSADNPDNQDPQDGDGQSEIPDKYQDKSFEEVAQMHQNAQQKISEQSEKLQDVRDKMNRLEGKMEGMGSTDSEESEEDQSLDRDELKEQAVQNVSEKLENQDFLDADPAEYTKLILDEVDRLVQQREEQLQSQINEQKTQQIDRRAQKAQDELLSRYPDAQDYLDEMGEIVTENPMIAQRVQQAPDVDQAVDHLEEALILAKKRSGDSPLLERSDETEESDSSNSNDTGNSSVTNGTPSSQNRSDDQDDGVEQLEELVTESLERTNNRFS